MPHVSNPAIIVERNHYSPVEGYECLNILMGLILVPSDAEFTSRNFC